MVRGKKEGADRGFKASAFAEVEPACAHAAPFLRIRQTEPDMNGTPGRKVMYVLASHSCLLQGQPQVVTHSRSPMTKLLSAALISGSSS